MKLSLPLLTGMVVSSVLGLAPPAEALGAAVCTVSGTITFAPSSQTPTRGGWSIEPAVMECRGLFRGWERIQGPGSFTGSGSYEAAPDGRGTCLHHVGSGTVDYMIPTSEQDVHMIEPHAFVLAGGGAFTTPTLRGTFQVMPPYDGEGDCVTKPLTKALFLAQGVMVRHRSTSTKVDVAGESTFHQRAG